jgi:hypothetical protein
VLLLLGCAWCRNATFLACLQAGALLSWRASSIEVPMAVTVDPINQPKCVDPVVYLLPDDTIAPPPFSLRGGFASERPASFALLGW